MIKKRLIFTLLIENSEFVLSRNFSLQKVGDLDWLLKNYNFNNISNFIDELIILNVRNKTSNFDNFCNIIKKISKEIFIPVCAGGGVDSLEKAHKLLRSGADKIIFNSLIYNRNELLKINKNIGQQSMVISVDLKKINNKFFVFDNNNLNASKKIDFLFKKDISNLFGEIYLNSVDKDGTGQGYCLSMINEVREKIKNPIILAGGAGNWHHLLEGLQNEKVSAVATANLLNFIGDGLKNARLNLHKKFDLAIW